MRDVPNSPYRVTEQRQSAFGPSLEWQSLPQLGEERRRRHAFRARAWRWQLIGLAIFWGGVGAAVAGAWR